jgi:hypothetical protein
MGEVQQWIDQQQEDRLMAIAQRQIDRGTFSVEIQKYMIHCAMETAARNRIMLGTPDADHFMESIEAIIFLTWFSLKKGDPKITMEEVKGIVKSEIGESVTKKMREAVDLISADDPKLTAPDSGSQTSGAPQNSDSTGGGSTTNSSSTARRHGKKSDV